MWPFKKKVKPEGSRAMRRLVAGLIIGGAIGSIVGKNMMEKHEADSLDKEKDDEEEDASA